MKTIDKKISKLQEAAQTLAINEVERLARKILTQNKNLISFRMAMGTYFFVDKKDNIISTTEEDYVGGRYVQKDARPSFKELNDFIVEWDDTLHMTGYPMTFTAKGKIITNW